MVELHQPRSLGADRRSMFVTPSASISLLKVTAQGRELAPSVSPVWRGVSYDLQLDNPSACSVQQAHIFAEPPCMSRTRPTPAHHTSYAI